MTERALIKYEPYVCVSALIIDIQGNEGQHHETSKEPL